ncbi:MAG TPA: hypothetical protein PL066_00625 [bacterium]|nr:hypothetical protein [bacterium]
MSEDQQKKIKEIYNRIQENKGKLKELKTSAKDVLSNDFTYSKMKAELDEKRKELKILEKQLITSNMINYDQMENFKIDIKTDEELLKDVALSMLMKNEQVELVDKYENKYVPELKVAFKRIN